MKPLKGKKALLTGGSRGLGPHIAEALAEAGVDVALTARSETGLAETARKVQARGVKSAVFPADITDPDARNNLVEKVRSRFGPIDILVNNAGMEWVCAYDRLSPGQIEGMVTTNLIAPMLLTRQVLPEMLDRGVGHIVTMASLGGKKGSPYSATYAATKAGLIQWTSGLRAELHGTGVSASVICPGFVSGDGMFAVYGKQAPGIVGETTPAKVAEAVIRAIRKNRGEIVVNSKPVWPLMVMEALHPDLPNWLLRTFGVHDFYRNQARDNEAEEKGL